MSEQPLHKKAVIIGAGISGLCCTHKLAQSLGAENVLCLEAGSRAGGYIQSENIDGYICDIGPNGFLDKEPATLDWIDQLGISDELIRANEAAARRFLLLKNRLVEMKPPAAFLLSPALSIPGRLRLMREPFIPQKTDDSPESIWDFAARRIGPEAADNLVSAMVLGVYGGDAKKLSLTHCFPRMAEMERVHGSLIKAMIAGKKAGTAKGGPSGPGGTLTTFKTGIGRLTQRAAEVVSDSLKLNTPVASITKSQDGTFRISTGDNNQIYTADTLICALPAHASADLFRELAPDLPQAFAHVRSEPIAVVCTGHERTDVPHKMDGFGFLVPPNQNKSVLGCIWTSSLFDNFAPENRVYLRTMIGGAIHPEHVEQSDDQLLSHVRDDVFPHLGIKTDPQFLKIYRHLRGIPQYTLDHAKTLTALSKAESDHPNLHFTGNSYHGISMNDCVKHACEVTDRETVSLTSTEPQ
ncbi:MAG: protoporphyrinogen oxidase [Candidatus Hydrogenedentota bacterium]